MTATLPDRQVAQAETTAVRAPRRRPRPPVVRRPRTTEDESRLVFSSAMAMVALLCLWLVFQLVFLGGLSEGRAQTLLYRDFRTQLASGTAPVGPVTPVGDPVAVLTIPAIDLEQTVVEGTSSGDTTAGPGHLRTTVLPGQSGTSVLMGRARTYGGPFGALGRLRPGDEITTTTGQGTTTYSVLDVRRPGDEVPQPLVSGGSRLVLISAEGAGAFGALTSGAVIYVDADATSQAFATPSGLPSTPPASELPLATDTGSLPLLVLYLVVLLGISLGTVGARQRYRPALVWLVVTPLALAMTWATTDVLVRLLPNLL